MKMFKVRQSEVIYSGDLNIPHLKNTFLPLILADAYS